MASPLIYIAEGFLLGIATGPLCVVSCGPVYVPYLMQKDRSVRQSIMTLIQMSVGRFVTYLVIGLAAGALGTQIAALKRAQFTAAAYFLFSVFLVISAIRTRKCDEGCRPAKWSRFTEIPFILGMATGISFCPSFLLALTKALNQGGPVAGALLFGAFFIGTNIYFIPFVIFGIIGKTSQLRAIARIASFVVALWFFFQAIFIVVR
jgi:sulfite exporter TauE/SafE